MTDPEEQKRFRVYANDYGDFWVLHTTADSKMDALHRFYKTFPQVSHLFRGGNVSIYLDSPRFRAQYLEGYSNFTAS